MGPFSASDRHDLPGLIDEPVPGFATQRDDIVVGLEYPVGKPVIAHELPYVFDGVQLGRSWWQEHQCDVGWDLEPAGGVPSGPVDDEYSVSAWCHQGRDFIKMPLHGLSVAAGQDKARTDTARGTDGTEDIGRLRALVPERRGSAAASRPAPGEHGFLADPGLILTKFLSRSWPGAWLGSPPTRRGSFFKILDGKLVLPLVAWSRRYLAKPQRPQFTAHRRLINRNAELFEYPMRQVLSAPTHDTVDRRNRAALNKPSERLSLPVIELGRLACRLAVNQTIRPLGLKRRTQSRTTCSPTAPRAYLCSTRREAAGSVQHYAPSGPPKRRPLPVRNRSSEPSIRSGAG